ncbi:uncharacterized protein PFL1_02302 [Pseudozyma flocculosa PF-1]|uniref:BZIP domain-containing protein n=1 Tax=Pseudozyma flocculosa TaxID=84751 RepID=A0A5C3F5W5_9BASI|nr:uncharacterized protein PFL1_02302 [Pseudozyma flocculosa PF-1]EPQ30186.1 hypothetical protein PFL1_02302 [Pseudozyma flocculosa PF-1]SPO39888.1 uncharacterized protein PSFLO_05369 [Pseudozyma flocculosa]
MSTSTTTSPLPLPQASTLGGAASTPIAEVRTQASPPCKRKALSPPEDPAGTLSTSDRTSPAPSRSSPPFSSSSSSANATASVPTTAATSASTTTSPFRNKPTDEEKRQRREARQARNRQSAQNSRERKKVYVEQLEAASEALRAENDRLVQQLQHERLVSSALKTNAQEQQARIDALEALVRELLKAGGYAHLSSILAALASSAAAPSLSSAPTATTTPTGEGNLAVTTPLAGPATIAAPVATAPTTIPTVSPSSTVDSGSGGGSGSCVATLGSSIVSSSVPEASPASVALSAGHVVVGEQRQEQPGVAPCRSTASADQGEMDQLEFASFIDLKQLGGTSSDGDAAVEAQAAHPEAASQAASVSVPSPVAPAAAGTAGGRVMTAEPETESSSLELEQMGTSPGFGLLNSPFVPHKKSAEETATDALLAEIYGASQQQPKQEQQDAHKSAEEVQMLESSDAVLGGSWDSDQAAWSAQSDGMASQGASPFDLVDLDIEIEEPGMAIAPSDRQAFQPTATGQLAWDTFLGTIAV